MTFDFSFLTTSRNTKYYIPGKSMTWNKPVLKVKDYKSSWKGTCVFCYLSYPCYLEKRELLFHQIHNHQLCKKLFFDFFFFILRKQLRRCISWYMILYSWWLSIGWNSISRLPLLHILWQKTTNFTK